LAGVSHLPTKPAKYDRGRKALGLALGVVALLRACLLRSRGSGASSLSVLGAHLLHDIGFAGDQTDSAEQDRWTPTIRDLYW
jgi:hypothetical protein